ncbi:MAG: hypothetical protein J2P16_00045 [Mycobacterium sp.]|nr:hypothetical protein [Mycobacterium sp.]
MTDEPATIFGLPLSRPWPQNWTPLEAVAVVKCLDDEGSLALNLMCTPGLTEWESVGMLTAARSVQLDDLDEAFIEGGEP